MKKYGNHIVFVFILTTLFASCSQKRYVVSNVEGSRVLMDSTWDRKIDPVVQNLINTYKQQLDSKMNLVIGEAAQSMKADYPQSLLSNLTSDVIKQFGGQFTKQPVDFAVSNVHGHRASLAQGAITVGNMYEIYSFDNLVVILDLDGKAVKELFQFYAIHGGEGLSKGVELVIKNKQIISLTIGGKQVDDKQIYRVATIDYLAEGNDGMIAFRKAKNTISTGITLRDAMIEYVKSCTAKGQKIDSRLDNRITIEK